MEVPEVIEVDGVEYLHVAPDLVMTKLHRFAWLRAGRVGSREYDTPEQAREALNRHVQAERSRKRNPMRVPVVVVLRSEVLEGTCSGFSLARGRDGLKVAGRVIKDGNVLRPSDPRIDRLKEIKAREAEIQKEANALRAEAFKLMRSGLSFDIPRWVDTHERRDKVEADLLAFLRGDSKEGKGK